MRTLVAMLLGSALTAVAALAPAPAPDPAKAKAPAPADTAAAPQAPAQAGKPPAKPSGGKVPEYDPSAEVKITGVVEDFHQSQTRADHPGLHLMLKTETETVEVHTCPVRFMKDLEFAIQKGDTLVVTGSRPGGGGIVLAREITRGQMSLIVRDKTGAPAWTR